MLSRRRLLTGAGVLVLGLAGLGRVAGGYAASAITVYKNPT
jgi:hypothetical protein